MRRALVALGAALLVAGPACGIKGSPRPPQAVALPPSPPPGAPDAGRPPTP